MIYPDTLEQKLGFDQIRQKLKDYCLSSAGEFWVDAIQFNTDVEYIGTLLKQNLEFRQILEKGEPFPSRYFLDADEWLRKIGVEGDWLEAEDFLSLAYSIETIVACKYFLKKSAEAYPELFRISMPVVITDSLSKAVFATIDDKGLVRDSASPELSRLRKKLRDEQGRLRKLADQLYKTAVSERWVPEGALPTIRDGRIVIPVLAEHKRKLKGFILDESATGQTVFLEPAEMLDSNNEIRDLEHAEKREVVRILRALTDSFRQSLAALEVAFTFLGKIDFIRAKGTLSLELKADLPIVVNQCELVWYKAIHPLLYLSFKGKREVIPLSIELRPEDRMLLVSGPNAGGKSVCLKTVGLLQYMLQCGLLVPMSERSRAGIFDSIFLDIGDQQSIENDLSTYSSHLRNMNVFIQNASGQSLVLLDELGSGTDPNFGGAIAQAILDELLQIKVWGVATTHYYNLKLYAGQQRGIRNAAMRFDNKNLKPLYELHIGKPGSSFALEIARKTGLPENILQTAETLVGQDLAGFEALVRTMEHERQEIADKARRIEAEEFELKAALAKYQRLYSELDTRKKDIIGKAKEDASNLLKQTNREIEKTIRHIKENKAEKKETSKVRQSLRTLTDRVGENPPSLPAPSSGVLKAGDRVRFIGQDGTGTIVSINGKNAMVEFGSLKSLTKIDNLEKASAPMPREAITRLRSAGINVQEKRANFNSTLDIRGKRVDEVIEIIDQFIDTAILLAQGELKILHGKGEGVLRKVVREHLKRYKDVESIRDEHVEQGGDGITVVVLK